MSIFTEISEPILSIDAPVPEIATPVPEIETPVPEIETPVPEIETPVPEIVAPVLVDPEEEVVVCDDVVDHPSITEEESEDECSIVDNAEDFWYYIKHFLWKDKFEDDTNLEETKMYIKKSLDDQSLINFTRLLNERIEWLSNVLIDPMYPQDEEKRKLCSHVVARGEEFYYRCLVDPIILNYLLGGYYQDFSSCVPDSV
jgi:hypothetical protein